MNLLTRFVLLVLTLFPVAALAVDIATPVGLNSGDTFRLVFVTDNKYSGEQSDPEAYDLMVNNDAQFVGGLMYGGQTIAWQALIATIIGVNEREYTLPLARVPTNSQIPIYQLNGLKVADSGTDFWDGSLQNPINITPSFYQDTNDTEFAWTGFDATGHPEHVIGSSFADVGLPYRTDGTWAVANNLYPSGNAQLYAVSGVLTVVPEPTTTALLFAGAVVIFIVLRSQKNININERNGQTLE